MKKIAIIGASGHGKVVADIALKNHYTDCIFLDDNVNVKSCGHYPVVGTSDDFIHYPDRDFIVAIGNCEIRSRIQNKLLRAGVNVATLIHPAAIIADDVKVGRGSVVMAGAVINPFATIGEGVIINTCASVDHDSIIGDFVHVSVGANIAGTVVIGNQTWIGVNAAVSNNITICDRCMIGAGAVVVKDIDCPGTYIGVPAKKYNK